MRPQTNHFDVGRRQLRVVGGIPGESHEDPTSA